MSDSIEYNISCLVRPDPIDLLFLGSSCTFIKWEIENNFEKIEFFFSNYCILMQIWASFSFYFYPFPPFQMGMRKIQETTNQLSQALIVALVCQVGITAMITLLQSMFNMKCLKLPSLFVN